MDICRLGHGCGHKYMDVDMDGDMYVDMDMDMNNFNAQLTKNRALKALI